VFVPYTVKNGETLYQIAHRMHVSEFLIRNYNESLQDWDSQVGPGEKIFVPNYYSKKTVLYIDKGNKHPIYQEMFDEKGMFEKYLFLDLSINPKLGDSDFAI
jgi:LysM repeat protein